MKKTEYIIAWSAVVVMAAFLFYKTKNAHHGAEYGNGDSHHSIETGHGKSH